MIKSVIIDDEPDNVIILRKMLQEFCPGVLLLGEANNAVKAVTLIRQVEPDLVFLDIEMPYGNGFDILDRLLPVRFEVIFITAFREYSLKAIRYSALDYLLKPVDITELKEAVTKAEQNLQSKDFNLRLENFLMNVKTPSLHFNKIALPGKAGVVFVPISDIIRCEASSNYTFFIIKNRGKIISSKSIKEYEAILPAAVFFRVHNSHLVNLNYVQGYQWGRGGCLEMEDGVMIEVASRRKDELIRRLGLERKKL
jgi:two-component system, LytTR family, response regulator